MAEPRKLTDVAIDCALHALPEPQNGWREHLPPEDLGAMKDAGSGQITLQAIVALLWYGKGAERGRAVRTLTNYADLCPRRIGLSEPWSWIYFAAIVSNWLAVVVIAERIGERELARRFRHLLSIWAGTCALMAVHGVVLMAGCRGWGHEVHGGGWDSLWAFARGSKDPPKPGKKGYGEPGASDDWGWINRCAWIGLLELRSAATPFLGRDWSSLLPSIPRWGARTEFQLLGWEDGSRLCIMGDDESGFDDEDPNGNTPGLLAAGVLGGKIVTLPKWPNPYDGAERLRQTNCQADIDGDPAHGWTLFHSHLGEKQIGTGFTTSLPPYTASPLTFWAECPAGSTVWNIRVPGEVVYPPEPIPSPTEPGNNTNVHRRETFLQKLWRWLRGGR